ncbi:MAG: GNAT family N-acetyltransferase [Armatimonadetes bacterium]|nr:GNAT family N-acetyltransferase [Armatimonadota bacterium]
MTFRPVADGEQAQALSLWQAVFGAPPGYFERYYQADADPSYREGDTFGAWQGDQLVSAVHLCRRPVVWDGDELLCGGIANVATLPEFRRRGLSRRLLEMAIAKMEREGFHYSLLGTGVPGHYAALGWELTHAPRAKVNLKADFPTAEADWQRLGTTDALPPLYAARPRPLQFVRAPSYFDGWVGWNWRGYPTYLSTRPGLGYLVLVVPEAENEIIFATEWRAIDAATERALLQAAAAEVLRRGRNQLGLEALPQHTGSDFLNSLGAVTTQQDKGSMARNLSLPDDRYRQLMQSYRTGEAVWWMADGF